MIKATAPLLSFCTAMALMALGNLGTSSGLDKRFSSRHLVGLRRYRILLSMDADSVNPRLYVRAAISFSNHEWHGPMYGLHYSVRWE